MTIKLIGVKDFRQNMAKYTKQAKQKNIRYIILKKNIPVLEIRPIDEKEFALEKLASNIADARQEVKSNHTYTQEEVMSFFGLQ